MPNKVKYTDRTLIDIRDNYKSDCKYYTDIENYNNCILHHHRCGKFKCLDYAPISEKYKMILTPKQVNQSLKNVEERTADYENEIPNLIGQKIFMPSVGNEFVIKNQEKLNIFFDDYEFDFVKASSGGIIKFVDKEVNGLVLSFIAKYFDSWTGERKSDKTLPEPKQTQPLDENGVAIVFPEFPSLITYENPIQVTSRLEYKQCYGKSSQTIYDNCCLKLGFKKAKRGYFGMRGLLYSDYATKEGYGVLFLPYSNFNNQSKDVEETKPWQNFISADLKYIKEVWKNRDKLENTSFNCKRVAFIKQHNQQYVFVGIYKCKKVDINESYVLYEQVSKFYPEDTKNQVYVGSFVKYLCKDTGETFEIQIANSKQVGDVNQISKDSILGKALIGKKIGDKVTIEAEEPYIVEIISVKN